MTVPIQHTCGGRRYLMFRRLVDKVRQLLLVSGRPSIKQGERPLLAFVSSVIRPELDRARQETVHTLDHVPFLSRWVFEFTPGSSEPVDYSYLRKIREADLVIWLVGKETTEPVCKEIREALASDRRLWAVKLPAERRDAATEALLKEVELRVKWIDVTKAHSLGQALELTLEDEIVRAMRATPGLGRLARLEELGRASRARCIMRWQAAGVARTEASNFAENLSIGAPGPELQLHIEKLILLLIGEIGAGKSLIAERLLQGAVMRARGNADAPVPVYLDARSGAGRLREAIEEASSGLGNPRLQGATVIIDGADEVGSGPAAELLNEARVLIGTWPNTTMVITSRSISSLAEAEETAQVPQLSEVEAYALIGQLAGHPVTPGIVSGWPQSVQDAVRRPLFAILMGIYLREQDMRAPRSTGQLLFTLVERALSRARVDVDKANRLLQRLGVLSMDRTGGPVPAAEVASKAELRPLLESGLVIERSGSLAFPLPILTQWFAAHSLAAGIPGPGDLTSDSERLERWRYPLAIFAGTFAHDQVSRVLAPLAENHPAIAAEIVSDGLARWGLAEDVSPPPPLECAGRVRTSMQAWTRGIGPLAHLIAPVRKDGMLLPIGARTDGIWLTIAWYRGGDELDKVVKLPPNISTREPSLADWPKLHGARPGRQPAWAWRWALDELVSDLSRLLQRRALPASEGPLAREAAWQAALAVTGRGSLHPGPIPVAEIEECLSSLPDDAVVGGIGRRWCDLNQLRVEVNRLREVGETELDGPWPGPDRHSGGVWIWSSYTDDQMLARTQAVCRGALEGYRQLVHAWFRKLAPKLHTAVILPARFVGVVVPPRPEMDLYGGPSISWYFEALPYASHSTVDLRLGEYHMRAQDVDFRSGLERLRSLRPQAAMWISFTMHTGILDVFGPNAATELAYSWLWDDLRRVSWVEGLLGSHR